MYELAPTSYDTMSSSATGLGGMAPSAGGMSTAGAGAASMNPMMMAMALGGLKGLNSQPKGQFVDLGHGYKAYVKTPFTDKLQAAFGGAAEAGLGMALQQQMADASRKNAMEDYMAKETVRQGFEMAQDRRRDAAAGLRQENQQAFEVSMAKAANEREIQLKKNEQEAREGAEEKRRKEEGYQKAYEIGLKRKDDEARSKEEDYQKAYDLGLRLKSNEVRAKGAQGVKREALSLKERIAIVNTAKDLMAKNPKLDEDQAVMMAEEMYDKDDKEKEGPKMKLKGGTDAFERAGILSNISGY